MLSLDQIFRSYLEIKSHYSELERELVLFRGHAVKSIAIRELFLDKVAILSQTLKRIYPIEAQFQVLKQTDAILKNPLIIESHPFKTLARNIDLQIEKVGQAKIGELISICSHEALLPVAPMEARFRAIGFNLPLLELFSSRLPQLKMLPALHLKMVLDLIARLHDQFESLSEMVPEFNLTGRHIELCDPPEKEIIRALHAQILPIYNGETLKKMEAVRLFHQMTNSLLRPRDLVRRLDDEPIVLGEIAHLGMKANLTGSFSMVPGDEIGRGSFGKISNLDYCGKKIVVKKVEGAEDAHDLLRGSFIAMQWLQSPYCTRVIGIEDEMTAMEKAETNLFHLIAENKKFLTAHALEFYEDMVKALGLLHFRNLTHGDLSTGNFLFFVNPSDPGVDSRNYRMQIADYDSVDFEGTKRLHGTYLYTAPEMALDPALLEYPTKKTNCWALGAILYELICDEDFFIDVPDGKKQDSEFVFQAIRDLTQEQIDAKIAALEKEERLAELADQAFTAKLKVLGKKEAQALLIEIGRSKISEKEIQEELAAKGIAQDLGNRIFRQFLLDLGVKKFLEENPGVALKNLFIKEGFKVYQALHPDKAHLEAEIKGLGDLAFARVKGILSGLLQKDPAKRVSLEEIIALFFNFDAVIDAEKPSEKTFALLEIDDA